MERRDGRFRKRRVPSRREDGVQAARHFADAVQVIGFDAGAERCRRRDGDRGGVVEALATIKIPVLVVSIDTDRLFPPRLQEEIVEFTPTALPLVTISSPFGHDGFLIEVESVGNILRDALAAGAAETK